jgi:hypothetical protein
MSSKSGPGYRGYEANPVAMASLSVENLFNTPYSRYPDVLRARAMALIRRRSRSSARASRSRTLTMRFGDLTLPGG